MSEAFHNLEPGISHPLRNTAVRLLDDGRIAILAGDHCGMILDSETGEITIYGSSINFVSGELKIDSLPVNKELISDKKKRDWKISEYGGNISRRIRSIK